MLSVATQLLSHCRMALIGTSTPSKAMGTIVMLFMKSLILYSETRLLGRGIIFY